VFWREDKKELEKLIELYKKKTVQIKNASNNSERLLLSAEATRVIHLAQMLSSSIQHSCKKPGYYQENKKNLRELMKLTAEVKANASVEWAKKGKKRLKETRREFKEKRKQTKGIKNKIKLRIEQFRKAKQIKKEYGLFPHTKAKKHGTKTKKPRIIIIRTKPK